MNVIKEAIDYIIKFIKIDKLLFLILWGFTFLVCFKYSSDIFTFLNADSNCTNIKINYIILILISFIPVIFVDRIYYYFRTKKAKKQKQLDMQNAEKVKKDEKEKVFAQIEKMIYQTIR